MTNQERELIFDTLQGGEAKSDHVWSVGYDRITHTKDFNGKETMAGIIKEDREDQNTVAGKGQLKRFGGK